MQHWKWMLAAGLVASAACWQAGSASAATAAAAATAATAPAANTNNAAISLDFDASKYTEEHMDCEGQDVAYRAYRDIVYVAHPAAADAEQMNIFIPAAYFTGGTVNGYTAKTAPIFLPNGVGGYMPGMAGEPAIGDHGATGPNAALVALSRGYVVAAPAIRGRTTQDAAGAYVGKAPAFIVDYKAAVRYLRHNQALLPAGDTEKIISDGTSAGGALSALLGATGNSPDYAPYLSAIGAADERDDIFASMDYCPITNLEHADMAYEWMFSGVNEYHQSSMPPMAGGAQGRPPQGVQPPAADGAVTNRPANAPQETTGTQTMTGRQITASTAFSFQRSDKNGPMADASILRLMNPMNYIGSKEATVAPHWRIRHGAKDRDTSLAIPALLARKLQNAGYDVDFAAPWGKGHAGDYDLTELFDWADRLCQAR